MKGESSGMGDFPFGGGDSIFSHLFGGDVFGCKFLECLYCTLDNEVAAQQWVKGS